MSNQALELETSPYKSTMTCPFTLGCWKVQPALNRIEELNSGEQRTLEPRLMQLLCFLAANQGDVVDRATLTDELWPRVIVNENSLTRAVSELRKQLRSADNGSSKLIETISKKGYRLAIAPQSVIASSGAPAQNVSPIRPVVFAQFAKLPQIAAATAAVAGLLLTVGLSSNTSTLNIATTSLSSGAPLVDEIVAIQPNHLGAEITLSASEETRSPTETTRPVISYDGQQFAYLSYHSTGTTIYFGQLTDTVNPTPVYHHQDKLVNLTFSPTGNSLLFAKQPKITTTALFSANEKGLDLLSLNLVSGEVTRLVRDELETSAEPISEQNLT